MEEEENQEGTGCGRAVAEPSPGSSPTAAVTQAPETPYSSELPPLSVSEEELLSQNRWWEPLGPWLSSWGQEDLTLGSVGAQFDFLTPNALQ